MSEKKLKRKSKTCQKSQHTTVITTERFKRNYMERILKELKKDEKWKLTIAEELNCNRKESKNKTLEKFQKILSSSIANSLVEIDKECETLTFWSTANAFTFFEKLSYIF